MTPQYKMIDDLITEMFGEPDPALGGYVLDRGNLQAFAARCIEKSFLENSMIPIRNLRSSGTASPIVFSLDW